MSVEGGDVPVLQSMLARLLNKGHEVKVVETHYVWRGKILAVKSSSSTPGAIEILVLNESESQPGVVSRHSFTIMQPHRWKLGKNGEGQWTLWPPRAKSRRKKYDSEK